MSVWLCGKPFSVLRVASTKCYQHQHQHQHFRNDLKAWTSTTSGLSTRARPIRTENKVPKTKTKPVYGKVYGWLLPSSVVLCGCLLVVGQLWVGRGKSFRSKSITWLDFAGTPHTYDDCVGKKGSRSSRSSSWNNNTKKETITNRGIVFVLDLWTYRYIYKSKVIILPKDITSVPCENFPSKSIHFWLQRDAGKGRLSLLGQKKILSSRVTPHEIFNFCSKFNGISILL